MERCPSSPKHRTMPDSAPANPRVRIIAVSVDSRRAVLFTALHITDSEYRPCQAPAQVRRSDGLRPLRYGVDCARITCS
jgi:hypothetical protein